MTMCSSHVERILNEIQALDPEGKVLLYEILEKRRIEEDREAIALRCAETMKDYQAGMHKTGTPDDLFSDLENEV